MKVVTIEIKPYGDQLEQRIAAVRGKPAFPETMSKAGRD